MKTKTNIIILTISSIIVFYVVFIIYATFFYHISPSNSSITSFYCSSVLRGIKTIIKFGNEEELFNQKKMLEEIYNFDSIEINKRLTYIFKTLENDDLFISYRINVNNLTNGKDLFYDTYGSPLYFMHTNNLSFKKINTNKFIMINSFRCPFVVWSAGKNKINEFGYGDDIMPYQQ